MGKQKKKKTQFFMYASLGLVTLDTILIWCISRVYLTTDIRTLIWGSAAAIILFLLSIYIIIFGENYFNREKD